MRSSTLFSIAALLLAALSSLTGALAADDDLSAPLAAAGTTPNNLTGAGAMFGNKYQGDVSRLEREKEREKNGFRCAATRDKRKRRRPRSGKRTQP